MSRSVLRQVPRMVLVLMLQFSCTCATAAGDRGEEETLLTANGYRGIWYMNQPTKDEYRYKYSGGFATYPQQHVPIAIHRSQVSKTFFVYGGAPEGENRLLHMVSYFDHRTATVPRPRILLDKQTTDAHDNPTLSIDSQGHLWVFSNAHGTSRPAYIHRSVKPYDIETFERIQTTNFSYGQPWHIENVGFLFLHTRYESGERRLFGMTSPDGRSWAEPRLLAHVQQGHYQVSWKSGLRVGTAFNVHPSPIGLNARTNLYYMESPDGGQTWSNAAGTVLEMPIRSMRNPALVHDYQRESRLVYLKDLQFDVKGRPVVLFLTTRGFEPGPENGPRIWHTARWTGDFWEIREVTTSDHNYDFGSLYIEPDESWRILAPTDPGPQPWTTGGEVVLWTSRDLGRSWDRRSITHGSTWNHTYVRRPLDAHPDFAAFWADGNTLEPSGSRLYFADLDGSHVWRLPASMTSQTARPERVFADECPNNSRPGVNRYPENR